MPTSLTLASIHWNAPISRFNGWKSNSWEALMDEFPRHEMESMCKTIEQTLEKGKCKNGMPLSKEAFQIMFVLACGLHPKKLQALIDQLA
jgi:hypothetical protein